MFSLSQFETLHPYISIKTPAPVMFNTFNYCSVPSYQK